MGTRLHRRFPSGSWISQGDLSPNPQGSVSVAISEETVLIGSPHNSGQPGGGLVCAVPDSFVAVCVLPVVPIPSNSSCLCCPPIPFQFE
jgi:hypothetical protein